MHPTYQPHLPTPTPINSKRLMKDPILAADGCHYDFIAFQEYARRLRAGTCVRIRQTPRRLHFMTPLTDPDPRTTHAHTAGTPFVSPKTHMLIPLSYSPAPALRAAIEGWLKEREGHERRMREREQREREQLGGLTPSLPQPRR